jgi:hypothetical protein
MLHLSGHVAWLPWAAAAIVALLFAPLRASLQRAVNRLTFGRWDEPYDVLADLGQRLEATVDVDRLLDDVISELGSLGLDDVAIFDEDGQVIAGVSRRPSRMPVCAVSTARTENRSAPSDTAHPPRPCVLETAACSMISPGTSAVCCMPVASGPISSGQSSDSCSLGRRNGAGSDATCTTDWGRHWRATSSGST